MSNDEILTDDYVAGLLAQEANDCSLKYSAMGMEAFRTDKKPKNMPKPNTRFLRHIIKGTDHHNKTLLAKEAAESKARLRNLERVEEIKRLKKNPNARDIRQRQMGDIQAILGKTKRPRRPSIIDDRKPENQKTGGRETSRSGPKRPDRKTDDLIRGRHEDRRRRDRLHHDENAKDSHRHSSTRDHKASRRHGSDGNSSESDARKRSHRRRSRSRSPDGRRSQSPKDRRSQHRRRSPHESQSHRLRISQLPDTFAQDDHDDSDPLDDLIGPAPPTHRGRGRTAASAGIDRRFSDSYDPQTDVAMDEDVDGDWDDAVEAFRDRYKLRLNQDDRLRAAGFAETQIQKNDSESGPKDDVFKWAKPGEKRNWDRDKVASDGGNFAEPSTLFSENS